MRRHTLFFLLLIAAMAASLFFPSREAEAIPAFARKYQQSCSTCHGPFPRLKPYGEEFAARGFRLEDPSQEPVRAEHDVGDPLLKLPRDLPLAVRIEGHAEVREDAAAEGDFETPYVFKILSGGPITPRVSYYLYFIVEQNTVEGLEDAYLQFNDVFGSGVDTIFGQFQVSDPLFKRELRLERTDYEIYRTRVGEASPNLTYDRGLVFFKGLPGEVDLVLEIVNGNGIPKGEFDNDDAKNFALRVARKFGGTRLGLFGYWGKEEPVKGGEVNETTYFGPDLSTAFGKRWQLNLQYLERRDDDPFFTGGSSTFETRGGFAELHFFPQGEDGRWAVSGLYNRVESDDLAAEAESAALTVNYLLGRNLRLLAEVARDVEREQSRASVGVVTAF
ncbi:MAG TPA: hypothetical protein VI669_06400 [Vicinamibacteria bacterium]